MAFDWDARVATKVNAAALALGVYAFLHLAIGARLFAGYNWWWVLVWAPNWRVLVFHHCVFAAVAVLVYVLRLQGLTGMPLIQPGKFRPVIDRVLTANAALTAAAVFLGLYLAVGGGIYGLNVRYALTWPYQLFALPQAVLVVLAAFAGVSLFVYRLRLGAGDSPQALALEAELASCREQERDLRIRFLAGEENYKAAVRRIEAAEGKVREAEKKAAAAEERASRAERGSGQHTGQSTGGSAGGADQKFQAARKAFVRLYHPDNVKVEGLDRMIRQEIFKEFWRELEAIQKGN
jgi:hypothetical protein